MCLGANIHSATTMQARNVTKEALLNVGPLSNNCIVSSITLCTYCSCACVAVCSFGAPAMSRLLILEWVLVAYAPTSGRLFLCVKCPS